jgi:mono/diheme cytochrome c family protein
MRRVMTTMALWLCIASPVLAQEWKAPASAKSLKNPIAKDAGSKEGKALYDRNCVLCHGNSGKGDGPAGSALNPKPKNLADKAIQGETDGELFWKISEGRGVMPPFKSLPEKERWSLVHYLRALAGAK